MGDGSSANLDLLLDIELQASLRFGGREMLLSEILDMAPGDVVPLDRSVHAPVDLVIGDRIVARGEVVLVDGNYGLRVTEVAEPRKRSGDGAMPLLERLRRLSRVYSSVSIRPSKAKSSSPVMRGGRGCENPSCSAPRRPSERAAAPLFRRQMDVLRCVLGFGAAAAHRARTRRLRSREHGDARASCSARSGVAFDGRHHRGRAADCIRAAAPG